MKLTETQIKILAPLQANHKKSHEELSKALFLIAGKTFVSYEIKEGELIILDKEEGKELIKP